MYGIKSKGFAFDKLAIDFPKDSEKSIAIISPDIEVIEFSTTSEERHNQAK